MNIHLSIAGVVTFTIMETWLIFWALTIGIFNGGCWGELT
jgi:hypothetical protein